MFEVCNDVSWKQQHHMTKGGWRTYQLQSSGYYWTQGSKWNCGCMLQALTVCIRFCFVLQENKISLLFIYFSMNLNPWWVQHHADFVSKALAGKLLQDLGWTPSLFPWAQITFPRSLWERLIWHQKSLCCSLLCLHTHISCLERILFNLGHKHLRFSEELCVLSGSGDFAYSQQEWPWTVPFQICLSF